LQWLGQDRKIFALDEFAFRGFHLRKALHQLLDAPLLSGRFICGVCG
jgi:hypothetical protein